MKGSTISTLTIAASIIAVAALVTLAVLRMGWSAGGGVAGSVSLAEQGGVMTATIQVLRGSLMGVAVRYGMPDGTAWWAKPIFCLSVNNTARLAPTAAYFSEPIPAGQTISCAFYIWAPSNGMYNLWIIGYGPSSAATLAQAHLLLSANRYEGNLPAGAATSGSNAVSVPLRQSVANYTLVPVNWRGGNLAVQVTWGYNQTTCLADGLYVSFFAPTRYTAVVWPWTPVGSIPQVWVEFNPYNKNAFTGWIPLTVFNVPNSMTYVPRGFNPLKLWPTNVWTTYVVYNGTSNTMTIEWIVPGVFDLVYTYDLGASPYNFAPPPPGQYYVVLGVTNGWCAADWKVYSYTVAAS